MSNSKKYADVVREDKDTHFCRDFVKSYVLKSDNCAGIFCSLNTWNNRQTSWTGADEIKWKYAKLAESEE